MIDATEAVWQGQTSKRIDGGAFVDLSVDDGQRVQLTVLDRLLRAGDSIGGWKVGLTSGRMRDSFGPGLRPFGYVLARRVFRFGARIERAAITRPGIETELCFRIGRPLGSSDLTDADARAGVAGVMPAFEINEDRIQGAHHPGIRVADGLRNWGIVVGDEIAPPSSEVLASIVSTLRKDGTELQRVAATGHIDDHYASLATLARRLARFGRRLDAGALVITGSFTNQPMESAGRYVGELTGIGSVEVVIV